MVWDLDSYMQKNETRAPTYTMHKNQFSISSWGSFGSLCFCLGFWFSVWASPLACLEVWAADVMNLYQDCGPHMSVAGCKTWKKQKSVRGQQSVNQQKPESASEGKSGPVWNRASRLDPRGRIRIRRYANLGRENSKKKKKKKKGRLRPRLK